MSDQRFSDRNVLVVAVRGWTTTGDQLLFGRPGGEIREDFVMALEQCLESTEVWAPDLDMSMFSMRSPESLSQELFRKITAKVQESPNFQRIILLGYSAGSLLVRRVFCIAHGGAENGEVDPKKRAEWADKIDRVVMLAGMTRGWEFSSASPAHVRFAGPLLQKITSIVGWRKARKKRFESKTPLIWQLKRGSPFVIATRIQYINVFQYLHNRPKAQETSPLRVNGLPSTVFLLGAKDEFISPSDCTELGPRIEFAFIELRGSNHMEALNISGSNDGDIERLTRLKAAITDDFASFETEPWSVLASDIDDYLDPMDIADARSNAAKKTTKVDHAVIVVHGIRDNGFWTKRVAREIKSLGRANGISVRAPTPSYGYFSMWDFIKPGGREKAAFWFMERYADVKSHFPEAEISFVGHSNGTYIAARSLELCSAIKFENIVFAGSVVQRGFLWSPFAGRVKRVLNLVGSEDKVVAFLPAVFERFNLNWLDVGGAGAYGFKEADSTSGETIGLFDKDGNVLELSEFRFIPGGHGAATKEEFWREIATFALHGTSPSLKPVPRKDRIRFLFKCAPSITVLFLLVAVILLTMPLIMVVITTTWVVANTPSLGIALAGSLSAIAGSLLISWLMGRFLRMW